VSHSEHWKLGLPAWVTSWRRILLTCTLFPHVGHDFMVSPGNLSIIEARISEDRYYTTEASKDREMESRNERETAAFGAEL
jgi:hypothetical protein